MDTHMLLDTYFLILFFSQEFFSIYSCFVSHLVFPWVQISGWILENFRFMTRNLKWTLSTAQESDQILNIFAYNYLIISSHSLNSWAAYPSPMQISRLHISLRFRSYKTDTTQLPLTKSRNPPFLGLMFYVFFLWEASFPPFHIPPHTYSRTYSLICLFCIISNPPRHHPCQHTNMLRCCPSLKIILKLEQN